MIVLCEGEELQAAYVDLLAGRVRLVGWGAIAPLPYYCLTGPLIPEMVIDMEPGKWGQSVCGIPIVGPDVLMGMPADGTIIMVHPIYAPDAIAQILEQIGQYGNYRAIPLFHAANDLHLLAKAVETYRLQPDRESGSHTDQIIQRFERLSELTADRVYETIKQVRPASRSTEPAMRKRVRLFIGRIQPGGAERQLTYLAEGLSQEGWDSAIRTFSTPLPGAESYLGAIQVDCQVLPATRDLLLQGVAPDFLPADLQPIAPFLGLLPFGIAHYVAAAYCSLMQDRPELVICYLDTVNVSVGIAALLAGVPHILVSGRNLNPTHFPNHYSFILGLLKPLYDGMLRFGEIQMSANSAAGARSYEEWLGRGQDAVITIPNGLPAGLLPPLDSARRRAVRAGLGVMSDAAPLIVGVFRLSEEKRPLLFVIAAGRLLAEFPTAHVALVGDGPQRLDVREAVQKLPADAQARFHLLGARPDATDYLGAADLVLHSAWAEGHPNVLMEAQLLGRPIVCTASYGTAECLYPCPAIQMVESDDPAALAQAAAVLLADPVGAAALARPAREWLLSQFSIQRLIAHSLAAAGIDKEKYQS